MATSQDNNRLDLAEGIHKGAGKEGKEDSSMRTTKQIKADIEKLEESHLAKKQALLKELTQSTLGVEVGDTITNGSQSIVISKIDSRYIKGTLTDTGYEIRVETLEKWKKVELYPLGSRIQKDN